MEINKLLNSDEYKLKLREHHKLLISKAKNANNEAETADVFKQEIYFFIRTFFKIDLNFHPEQGQKYFRHMFKGKVDSVSNRLIVEFKHKDKLKSKNQKDKAKEQISNYLDQLYNKGKEEYDGIVTDGLKIKNFYWQNNRIIETPFKELEKEDFDRIIKRLIDTENKSFVSRNLVEDFNIDSQNGATIDLAKLLFNKITSKASNKASMLFDEWMVLFHLSANDKGQNQDITKRRDALKNVFKTNIDSKNDYQSLFALQTSYAIIVKLIACKVITKFHFDKNVEYFSDLTNIETNKMREYLEYLEDGYIFQTAGPRNLFEGDFFSWYCLEELWDDDIANKIKKIISILENYSNTSFDYKHVVKDIFIELYISIIPQAVRHSLGEYFTPSWLADRIVTESIKLSKSGKNFNAIDPCCGSGVFIIALINKILEERDVHLLSEKDRTNLLDSILNRVTGVDINPISVLTSKVSYYLAIKPLIKGRDFEIPIYLGDSANIPLKKTISGVECYSYEVNTIKENISVILPISFVKRPDFFKLMTEFQFLLKSNDKTSLYETMIKKISKKDLNKEVKSVIKNLSSQLVQLNKKKWDGIWIRIVANFMLVAKISNIDIIVGNPPWVKWEFLPQSYANKIKNICVEKHLFSGQSYMGAISLNICALISNVTASSWLNKNGVLAFLMPQTLMTQDSYAGFRNFYIDYKNKKRMYLQKLDDWSKSGNPFVEIQEKFMTYYYKKDFLDYYKEGIPVSKFSKKKKFSIKEINKNQYFNDVKKYFDESSDIKAYQLDKKRTGYTTISVNNFNTKRNFNSIIGVSEYKARSGVEFTPAEIYFVEPKQKSNNNENYIFTSMSFSSSIYKSTNKLPFQLETNFIRPVIKAPEIEPFKFKKNNNYCIFPYEENSTNSISLNKLLEISPSLFKYLSSNKNVISKQSKRSLSIAKGKEFYSLSKVGSYTFSPYKVTFRDNTTLSAAVVKPIKSPWGKIIDPVCAKHCPYISQDKKGRNISEAEAYYLSGILNSQIVKDYFKNTYSGRSYSINFNIKMPLFDKQNDIHKKLSLIAKKAESSKDHYKILNELDNLYLRLCNDSK